MAVLPRNRRAGVGLCLGLGIAAAGGGLAFGGDEPAGKVLLVLGG